MDLLGFGFSDKFDRSRIQGFSGCLDFWFFKDLNQTGFFFRTFDFGFSLDLSSFIRSGLAFFGHWIRITYQSYLTIQTYNPTAFTTREETLYLKDAVITDAIVDLRYGLSRR